MTEQIEPRRTIIIDGVTYDPIPLGPLTSKLLPSGPVEEAGDGEEVVFRRLTGHLQRYPRHPVAEDAQDQPDDGGRKDDGSDPDEQDEAPVPLPPLGPPTGMLVLGVGAVRGHRHRRGDSRTRLDDSANAHASDGTPDA